MRLAVAVIASVLLLASPWASISWAEIDPGTLVGAWLMEETDDNFIPDISGNEHTGELTGDVDWEKGQFGQATSFPGGGSALIIPEFGMVAPQTEVTITVWTRVQDTVNCDIFSFDPLVGNNRITVHFPWDNSVIWQHGTDQHWCAAGLPEEAFDNWEFWAFIGSTKGNYLRILRDMEPFALREDEPTAKPAFTASAQNWHIGGRIGSSYTGVIDDVGVFNVALSDDDIEVIKDFGIENAVLGKSVDPAGKLAVAWASVKAAN